MEAATVPASGFGSLIVAVCVAATVVGGCMGWLGVMPYAFPWEHSQGYDPYPIWRMLGWIGTITGASSGLLVGYAWSRAMLELTRRGTRSLRGAGAGLGLLAGVISTVILHLILMAARGYGKWPDNLFEIGLFVFVFGMPVGVIVGAICGAAWRRRARSQPALNGVNRSSVVGSRA
jgi:hypothetical protein